MSRITDSPTMRYTYDTEFLEDGKTVELISIGIVADDGREYYAVNANTPVDRIIADDWMRANIWPSLPVLRINDGQPAEYLDMKAVVVKPKWAIANEVNEFLLSAGAPELWADYAAYDHVALCQLWGRMIDLPDGIPMFTHDIQHAISRMPGFVKPEQESGEHNALEDARHNMVVLRALDALTDQVRRYGR